MLHRMEEGYDVILASPYTYGGTILNTALHRRILSFFANLFLREILGLRGILTISIFFRLYKVSVLRGIQNRFEGKLIERQGFEGKVELLMKFVFQRTPISEVPLVLDTSNRVGRSKIKIIKTTLSLLALYFEKDRWRYDPSTL
jgi:dolichol-phosphate mannosyltransferase